VQAGGSGKETQHITKPISSRGKTRRGPFGCRHPLAVISSQSCARPHKASTVDSLAQGLAKANVQCAQFVEHEGSDAAGFVRGVPEASRPSSDEAKVSRANSFMRDR
jgi:hypothetical protein